MPCGYARIGRDDLRLLEGINRETFLADKRTVHAVIRNLEVLGEAAKRVPPAVRANHPAIPWQRIAGLRDILIHQYFDIDPDVLWNVVSRKIPEFAEQLERIHRTET